MPRTVDPDRKRADLVAASWDVIAREGLAGATLRKVAAEAGCTTGALTHYFRDRRALLTAALRAAHAQAGTRMAEAARAATAPTARLRAVLQEALPLDATRMREWRVWLAFWAESMHDPALTAENARRYDEWRALLRATLAPLCTSDARVEEELDALVALVDGLGVGLARHAERDDALAAQQEACEATLAKHLERFTAS